MDLSQKTGYSRSTLSRDIVFLETKLPEGWMIEKSDSKGIKLTKPENGALKTLLSHFNEQNTYYKTLKLLFYNDGVTINDITTIIHLSRSTAYRHIKDIKQMLQNTGVTLSSSPYKLIGDEIKIRGLMIEYLEIMGNAHSNGNNKSFNIEEFKTKIIELTNSFSIFLHTGAYQRLALTLQISNIRIKQGYNMNFDKIISNDIYKTKYFEMGKLLTYKHLAKCSNRNNQLQEIVYFAICIMSEEKPPNRSVEINYIRTKWMKEKDQLFDFLKDISSHFKFEFSEDDTLIYQLYQIAKRISIDSQLGAAIKGNSLINFLPYFESNPLFKMIEDVISKLKLSPSITIGRLEMLEIFLLLNAAILRKLMHTKIKVALICQSYSEQDYIKELLNFNFKKQLEITNLDYMGLEHLITNNEFDLIINTDINSIGEFQIPLIQLSSCPSPSELQEIEHFIKTFVLEKLGVENEMIYPYQ
ncbi:helix-turn-helix domain-containing protein [Viridibacillus sp. YIM B01967]|uniref:Helix-turn-helix domain-containing protein n=2 Tax=Viridibacillus soli TaxID=2798301 RepID=A0ABS1H2I9_9BACL|nr:helix-turn-helix domain-containing protein [Viridibacillus soli]